MKRMNYGSVKVKSKFIEFGDMLVGIVDLEVNCIIGG